MNVTVRYGRLLSLDLARRCVRCDGTGRERYVPGPCPRCNETGIRPDGWAYQAADDLNLQIGDVVEVPQTRRSTGPQEATVVALTADMENPYSSVLRVIERVAIPYPASAETGA